MQQPQPWYGSPYPQKDAFFSSEESSDPFVIVEHGENLFLMGRFKEALDLSVAELDKISNTPLLATSTTKTGEKEAPKTAKSPSLMSEHVTRLVALVIQVLFELNRHSEVMDLVTKFYGTTTERLPFQIFLLILNLQISLNLEKAKRMVVEHLRYRKNADADVSCKGKEKQDQYEALTQIQYSSIAELFVTRILIPLRNFEEAKSFVTGLNGSISEQKKKHLADEIERSLQAIKEAEKVKEPEEEEIQVERGREAMRGDFGDGEMMEEVDDDTGGEGSSQRGEQGEEDDDEFMSRQGYAYRMNRMKGSDDLSLSTLKDSSAASMVTQWASGLWQWVPLQGGLMPGSTVWVCAVLSFVASFFFLYLRKDVLSKIPNVFGNLKELLSLAFNIDRTVTGSTMMRRRRLQR